MILLIGPAVGGLCGAGSLRAQSLEQAKRLYTEGKYAEVKPAFEKLVRQSPNNASYNHWYGVCCFETGDVETAEPYLKTAAARRVQEAYRYLGELYIKTYRFGDAAAMYEEYIDVLAKKKENTEPYRQRLEVAEKARRMVEKVENVRIIDSVSIGKNRFLDAYVLSEEAGSLAFYGDFFRTGEPSASTVYMNEVNDRIYYAYPEEGHYKLFTQSKLLDKWGDEKPLPATINNEGADNNYPFVLTDGATVYYASGGNGSIGGYDLFVTRYNTHSDTYLAPEQLGMPFNSTANDYMLVIDEAKGLGWFVSDRNQPEGYVCVYLFIPDEQRSRIESDDLEMKRARALVTSIADTWEPAADYAPLIRLAHTELPSEKKEKQKDFEFVINNQVVYYAWENIQSPEARSLYEKRIRLEKEIAGFTDKLNALRRRYAQGSRAQKEQLKATILQAEDQLYSLLEQPAALEKRARKAEINYLKLTH